MMVHVQQGSLETLTVCSDSQSFGFPPYTQNPLQYCKVISLQLIKINEKKNGLLSPQMIQTSILKFLYMVIN